jgi:gliding motility-associated-like protein
MPQIIDAGNTFCTDDNATVAQLSQNIIQPEAVVWYDAFEGGNAYANTDALVDGTTYYAALQSAELCESAIRLAVRVTIEDCIRDIEIPDGFSPNDDGINDEFVIINLPELYPNFHLEIYNRYGNVLYKGNKDVPNWNGRAWEGMKFSNEVLPTGVYFFVLEFNDGIRKPIQGRVYLSR